MDLNKPPEAKEEFDEGQHKIGRPGSEMDSTLIYMDQAEEARIGGDFKGCFPIATSYKSTPQEIWQ